MIVTSMRAARARPFVQLCIHTIPATLAPGTHPDPRGAFLGGLFRKKYAGSVAAPANAWRLAEPGCRPILLDIFNFTAKAQRREEINLI
jgi:hypothetical protein